ncbi:N-(5'phosphoribosyl)anthranilate (PRA) isomerase [Fragilaria crotonensis]|nr:N-(5'phosphoribosyl)anthranilate (PRA) isomerase [Fragilaria crotonensis]
MIQPQVPAVCFVVCIFLLSFICLPSIQAFPISVSSVRVGIITASSDFAASQLQLRSQTRTQRAGKRSPPLFATQSPDSTTQDQTPKQQMIQHEYSKEQLKAALDSLLADSDNPSFDARHIYGYGYGAEDHQLSMLQTITATVLLDYQNYMNFTSFPSQESLIAQANNFATNHGPILDLNRVIKSQAPRMALAAEFKRASPSKGEIAMHLNAGEQATKYAKAGANIISVLTEQRWFKGSLEDVKEVRLATNTDYASRPAILRKEFIVNEYMIAEAAAHGADTVLLIVAVLPQHLLERLIKYCRSLGMEPLVEVHADEELEVALEAGATVIGINNRNLHTFHMDLGTTDHIAALMKQQNKEYHHDTPNAPYVLSSLSGMSTAMDVHHYREAGVGMCLIGESLMRATDPQQAIRDLCLDPQDYYQNESNGSSGAGGAYTRGTKLIKVCGITNAEDALVACQSGANLIGVIFVSASKRCVTAEQAKEVVETVRAFGERSSILTIETSAPRAEPVSQLVSVARRLEESAGKRPIVVGVFQNHEPEYVRQMVEECGLDMVQLHGDEGMEACAVADIGVPAIRVVDVVTDPETGMASSTAVEDLLSKLTTDPAAILLDTSIKGSKAGGGTGVTFDWTIAQRIQDAGLPVIIAGGLTPDNVMDAVGSVRPWGIDVSSGVEATPGEEGS